MPTTTPETGASPEQLRARMVDRIVAGHHTCSPRIEQALRTVPRHAFVPAASPEDAYADQAVITKRADNGAALSCASVPCLVATMLDQLDVQPGDHVLEIGAGTGYNAALLAHLTGPTGQVTTVDIDPDVTAGAHERLRATGNEHVHVATRDGALGDPDHSPYDRIELTVGAWDLPQAWWDQLVPGGRLVVPLRWRGQTRSVAFVREEDRLRSDSVELCGFVPMVGQDGEQTASIDAGGHVALHFDADQPVAPAVLTGVLDQPSTTTWSSATVGPYDTFDGVWLRLTATEPGTCRIAADATAVETGLCTPPIPSRSPALVEGDSLAYLTQRRLEGERRWQLGATGHGPSGPDLAERLTTQITAWNHDRDARPLITALPLTHTPEPTTNLAIKKNAVLLTLTY